MTVEQLQAENARLKTEVEHLMIFCNSTLIPSKELQAENASLKAEVDRLEQESNYWRIEAETDNARWLRVLEDVERLRKAGDKLVEAIQEMDVIIDMDSDHPEVKAWNAAKEGKQP